MCSFSLRRYPPGSAEYFYLEALVLEDQMTMLVRDRRVSASSVDTLLERFHNALRLPAGAERDGKLLAYLNSLSSFVPVSKIDGLLELV